MFLLCLTDRASGPVPGRFAPKASLHLVFSSLSHGELLQVFLCSSLFLRWDSGDAGPPEEMLPVSDMRFLSACFCHPGNLSLFLAVGKAACAVPAAQVVPAAAEGTSGSDCRLKEEPWRSRALRQESRGRRKQRGGVAGTKGGFSLFGGGEQMVASYVLERSKLSSRQNCCVVQG